MTVQRKKLIDDTGSAVVAECVSQLNRAASFTPVQVAFAGGGSDDLAHIFFHEDVYVTDVAVGLEASADFVNAADDIFIYVNDTPNETTPTSTPFSAEGFAAGAGALPEGDFYSLQGIADLAVAATGGSSSFPLRVSANSALVFRAVVASTSAGTLTFNVCYRPVKDELTLQPNVPNKLKNWSSTDR